LFFDIIGYTSLTKIRNTCFFRDNDCASTNYRTYYLKKNTTPISIIQNVTPGINISIPLSNPVIPGETCKILTSTTVSHSLYSGLCLPKYLSYGEKLLLNIHSLETN